MKTLVNVSIYQLTGDVRTFELFNSVEMPEEVEIAQLSELLAKPLFKAYSSQIRIKEVCKKGRFYGLATSKPILFELRIDGVIVFNSQDLPNKIGLRCKLSDLNEEQFIFLIEELLTVFL